MHARCGKQHGTGTRTAQQARRARGARSGGVRRGRCGGGPGRGSRRAGRAAGDGASTCCGTFFEAPLRNLSRQFCATVCSFPSKITQGMLAIHSMLGIPIHTHVKIVNFVGGFDAFLQKVCASCTDLHRPVKLYQGETSGDSSQTSSFPISIGRGASVLVPFLPFFFLLFFSSLFLASCFFLATAAATLSYPTSFSRSS